MLVDCLSKDHLRSFAPSALGTAAAAGNTQALDILLHYDQWHINLSTAIYSLEPAAAKGDDQAIDFFITVLENPKSRSRFDAATRALTPAAARG